MTKTETCLNELAADASISRPALDAVFRNGVPLFIFDAMDETQPDRMDRILKAIYDNLVAERLNSGNCPRILFTSRPGQKLVANQREMTLDNSDATVVRRYSVCRLNEAQRDEYIEKLAAAKRVPEEIKRAFLDAVQRKENEIKDYILISRNAFTLFAIFDTYRTDENLPENRFDAIVRVMKDIVKRELDKYRAERSKTLPFGGDDVQKILGKASCRLNELKDNGETPRVTIEDLLEFAKQVYNLDETDSEDRKTINEYRRFFETGRLIDENGFRHEFLASTYAAYYLYTLMKKQVRKEKACTDFPELKRMSSESDYWKSTAEALLCLLDRSSDDSKTYIEPLLEKLQNGEKPDYDLLCGSVSQFTRHPARSSALLLQTMLKRGCEGIKKGESTDGTFVIHCGENPYRELFYYPAIYPVLREYLWNLTIGEGTEEEQYIQSELVKEVRAVFSDQMREKLERIYDERKSPRSYAGINEKLEQAANQEKDIRGFLRLPNSMTAIGEGAFYGCAGLTSIEIPCSVVSIDRFALSGCGCLDTLTVASDNPVFKSEGNCIIRKTDKVLICGCKNSNIPSEGSVTTIGEGAFYGCDGLTSIEIPDSVTTIGRRAFCGCTSLTSIEIPCSVTSIYRGEFSGCDRLETLTVASNNPVFCSAGNCIIRKVDKVLVCGCKTSRIPSDGSVTAIGEAAFYGCTGLKSIDIPASVTAIDRRAFYGCTGLTSIEIPYSVTSIGLWAFSRCDCLDTLSVDFKNPVFYSAGNCIIRKPDKVLVCGCKTSSIPSDGSVTEIGKGAFYGCIGLTNIEVPDGVTVIGEKAFDGCTNLTSIAIPNSANEIGKNAFYGCASLTDVEIPDGVTMIGEKAFYGCASLTSIVISDSVAEIGEGAFYRCTSLKSIKIPAGVTKIGKEMFYSCFNLMSIVIPDSVTEIGESAFYGCASLENIEIPASVTKIGEEAFYSCSRLKSMEIPDSVTEIGSRAFDCCTGLTSIKFPSNAKLSRWMFNKCDGIDTLTVSSSNPIFYSAGNCIIRKSDKALVWGCKASRIPSDGSVTAIGRFAFRDCPGLTSIEIPNSVTEIEEGAFFGCTRLTNVEFPCSVELIGGGVFSGCDCLDTLTVVSDNPEFYSVSNCVIRKTDKVLVCGCKASRIPSDGSVTEIGEGAFYWCAGLTSIEIPSSVTKIGVIAFGNCSSLRYVRFLGSESQWNQIEIERGNDCILGANIVFATEE